MLDDDYDSYPEPTPGDWAELADWELAHDDRPVCQWCGSAFGKPGLLPGMKIPPYCGSACRLAAHRSGLRDSSPVEHVPPIPSAAQRNTDATAHRGDSADRPAGEVYPKRPAKHRHTPPGP